MAWVPSTDTQCVLKWAFSTIILFGKAGTSSCCKHPALPISSETFSNLHNLDQHIEDRKLMLEGKWPAGCQVCKIAEDMGASSDRTVHNKLQHLVPEKLKADPKATVIDPVVIELYFKNTCNMSCIYCNPRLSSKWQSEIATHGSFADGNVRFDGYDYKEDSYDELLTTFWTWLENNIHSLKELNLLGGEPFLMDEMDQLIDFLDLHPSPKLDFVIVSNLNIPEKLFSNRIDKLERLIKTKKVKSVKINASIDGWDKSMEFQRYGLRMPLFESNMNRLLSTRLRISINFAMTCLSIPSLPALIAKWLAWNAIHPVEMSGTKVVPHSPTINCLTVDVLPKQLLLPHLQESIDMIPDSSARFQHAKDRLKNVAEFVDASNSMGDPIRMRELKIFLDELSRRRNTKWQDYYPWLKELLDVV